MFLFTGDTILYLKGTKFKKNCLKTAFSTLGRATRTLCFSRLSSCRCELSSEISITNCGEFFVYRRKNRDFPHCLAKACTTSQQKGEFFSNIRHFFIYFLFTCLEDSYIHDIRHEAVIKSKKIKKNQKKSSILW